MSVRITESRIDITAETAVLSQEGGDVGALLTFTGVCRGKENGKPITALTLEHYPGMAEAEIERHIEEARSRWPLIGVHIAHRVGRIKPGEIIVFVATASEHRQAAFSAAEFLMDYLKIHAPFWKKVDLDDGAHWVVARDTDDTAAARWEIKRDAAE